MALINRAGQEISAKVVYYGPGLSGKTTNLEVLFKEVPEDRRGKMISMKTRTDRTLFFDLLPMNAEPIRDFQVRILLYTVPGQVYYNATRRLVLKGVDALVFVADSHRSKLDENLESLENLRNNLTDMNMKLEEMPWVIQYNKRDLPDILSIEDLEKALNPGGVPWFEAVAYQGEGVRQTLRGVTEILRPMLETQVENELGFSPAAAQPAPEGAQPQATSPAAPAPGGDLDAVPDPLVVEAPVLSSRQKSQKSKSPSAPPPPPPSLQDSRQDPPTPEELTKISHGSGMEVEGPLTTTGPLHLEPAESTPPAQAQAVPPVAPPQQRQQAPPPPVEVAPPAPPVEVAPPAPPPQAAEPAAPPEPARPAASSLGNEVEVLLITGHPGEPPELRLLLPKQILASGELRLRLLLRDEVPTQSVPEMKDRLVTLK